MPGTAQGTVNILAFILTNSLGGWYHYYHQFRDQVAEAEAIAWLACAHTVNRWQDWDTNPGLLAPEGNSASLPLFLAYFTLNSLPTFTFILQNNNNNDNKNKEKWKGVPYLCHCPLAHHSARTPGCNRPVRYISLLPVLIMGVPFF